MTITGDRPVGFEPNGDAIVEEFEARICADGETFGFKFDGAVVDFDQRPFLELLKAVPRLGAA